MTPPDETSASPVVVLVDDVRSFRDGRVCRVARTAAEAISLLTALRDVTIDELWLDYDLGRDLTVMPVVDYLVNRAASGAPARVTRILVHSRNVGGAHRITVALRNAGYPVEGSFTIGIWTRG
jgi:hypothetical protein